MSSSEVNTRVKFSNDDDFIDGAIEMDEMLEMWKSSAEDGVQREYTMTPKSEELILDIFLKVSK